MMRDPEFPGELSAGAKLALVVAVWLFVVLVIR
jgi:hypothetical protein